MKKKIRIGKKAQEIGQVFVFIIAIITFALIMIFGYKTITDFMHKGDEVKFYQFKMDLENSVKKIYTEYGSSRTEKFSPPSKISQVCFVDLDYGTTELTREMAALCAKDQVACEAWAEAKKAKDDGKSGYDAVNQNVFLKPLIAGTQEIKVFHISIKKDTVGFLCLPVEDGFFQLTLKGMGDRTDIS